ncbi:AMP-binding protein [Catelliglobosispora koreensis]|uniref:AMP-binding protein n=1 Tax=Catelliglobosispora koreensis TaxID=129052 RepID=UPI0009FE1B8B
MARAASEFGAAEAIAEPGGPRMTYAALFEQVQRVAGGWHAAGVMPGDRVAIWAPNTANWVLAALGALCAGAVLVPINTRYTAPEAQDIISRTNAKALYVVKDFLGRDRAAELADPPAVIWHEPHFGDPFLADVSPDDVCDILFTSGTTGRSKGAMSAHRQSLSVAQAWAECGELSKDDRYLVINPFFHSFGYKAGVLACLLTGATMVPQLLFDVPEAMRLVAAERITVLPGPPTIYQTILDHPDRSTLDLSSLRLAVTGAATVPVALIERMQRELSFRTVLTAYGMTEAVVITMCRPGDDPQLISTTSGRATAGFEVRLGEHDEILVRGPNVMLGYLDDPAETAKAIDTQGWLHTGDVGKLDDGGYLTITDRLKDMYICGGFNVYPAEVEQVIARLEGVAENVVIGIADHRLGEVGKAFVVPRPGFSLTEQEVIEHCRASLANYKLPRQVEFRADLPRNTTGKPLKRLLREETK